MDVLSWIVPMRINVAVQLTVMASVLYRLVYSDEFAQVFKMNFPVWQISFFERLFTSGLELD